MSAEAGRSRPGRPAGWLRTTGWSVRAQLVAAVTLVMVVLSGLIGGVAYRSLQDARHRNELAAGFQAGLASQAVTDALAQVLPAVVSTARGLDVRAIAAHPGACRLASAGHQLFPDAHLDVVLADGRVPCSSVSTSAAPAGATQAGAPWLRSPGVVPTAALFTDRLTGRLAIAVVAPTSTTGGAPRGFLAYVLPVDGLAEGLGAVYGGPRGFDMAVRDEHGRLLSLTSAALRDDAHVTPGSWIRATRTIAPLGWTLEAATPAAAALAPARTTFTQLAVLVGAAFLLLLLLLVVLNRRIATPLRQLSEAAARGSRQVTPAAVPEQGPAELRLLAQRFNAMVAAGTEFEQQLTHRTLHDPLTGLPNRALLLDRMRAALGAARPGSPLLAVLSVDLDRFKLVNAGLGYRGGDTVLVEATDRLLALLGPRDTLARFGGDGFVLCCPDSGPVAAGALAARIVAACAVPFRIGSSDVTLSASVGMALATTGTTPDELIRDADTAMYAAKSDGGGRVRVIDGEIRAANSERLQLEADLRAAVQREEFTVVYQPVVNLLTRAITGAEALLRWQHPTRGMVPPLSFIPLAEETGLIVDIGRSVLRAACAQGARWAAAGNPLRVAVNVSGHQLLEPSFVDDVRRCLAGSGLDGRLLCLELTETTLMDDAVRVPQVLRQLKDLGVSLSIDDFGTGYSSLSYLKRFPVDELKVDRSFVQHLGTSREDDTLVAAMVAMGHALGLSVIAEGIEEEGQVSALLTVGCRSAQGFLFSRPVPAERISALLAAPFGGHGAPVDGRSASPRGL